jgi:3-oxoadipate enol-lactonase
VEAFSERYQVVRYDLRGFGDSPLPGRPFSNVTDLSTVFAHFGLERAALVGNSFGGKVALEFALTYPERVSALVLVAPGLGGHEDSPAGRAFDEEEDALLDAGRIDDAVELNLRTWLGPVDAPTRERVGAMQRRALEVIVAAFGREPPPAVEWLEDPPAADRLGSLRVPTLVVIGSEDVADMRAIADRIAAEVPGARKVVLEGVKHLPGVERPDEFNRLVLEFLASA